eukprot:239043_1
MTMGKCYSAYSVSETDSYVNNCYSIGACSIGENSYSTCLSFPNHQSYSLFAVFQGLNGNDASQYLTNNLIKTLNKLDTLDDDKLIIDTITKMDEKFLFLQLNNKNINNSASTFVFALIQHPNNNIFDSSNSSLESQTLSTPKLTGITKCNELNSLSPNAMRSIPLKLPSSKPNYKCRIFWLGDCRAVIIKKHGKCFKSLTNDHCRQIKSKRELSRCFGYYAMKNNLNKYNQQQMICVTECKQFSFRSNQTLMLFSNGLTHKWYDNQMVQHYNTIYKQHRNQDYRMRDSLYSLVKQCVHDGSKQHIAAVAIKFY